MNRRVSHPLSKRAFIAVCLVWSAVCILPWRNWLAYEGNLYGMFLADMFRLGLALGAFILPGALLYLLLGGGLQIREMAGVFPVGFALSVFLIAALGLIGRVAGVSFALVRGAFWLTGLAELLLLQFAAPRPLFCPAGFAEFFSAFRNNPMLVVAMALAAGATFHGSLFFIDDTIYAAYLTHWQQAERLGFTNIIHTANVVEHPRFWLAMYPMGQALLADLSGLSGLLLLGSYLELFLVPLAVLAWFWLGRVLGLSPRAAGFSALVQVVLYALMVSDAWPPGTWFYQSLAEDKVSAAFLLSPVFFAFTAEYVQRRTGKNLALLVLCGAGIALTHPVMLFYSSVVACGMAALAWVSRRANWRAPLALIIVTAGLSLPYAFIRLSDASGEVSGPYGGGEARSTFQIERYVNIVSDIFYGLNPETLKIGNFFPSSKANPLYRAFRSLPIFLALLAGGLAALNLKKGPLCWYVLSSVLLVYLAALPYTGWLIGYFVSARMMARAGWYSPLGMGAAFIASLLWERFKPRPLEEKRGGRAGLFERLGRDSAAWLIVIAPAIVLNLLGRAPDYFARLDHYWQLTQIGAYVDQHTSQAATVIALNYEDILLLPSVMAHVNLISFREELPYNGHNNFMSLDEIQARIEASNAIRSLDAGVPPEDRCRWIRQYQVRFVVSPLQKAEEYAGLVGLCGVEARPVVQSGGLTLLEMK